MHMGETPTRLGRVTPRNVRGLNSVGTGVGVASLLIPAAYQACAWPVAPVSSVFSVFSVAPVAHAARPRQKHGQHG